MQLTDLEKAGPRSARRGRVVAKHTHTHVFLSFFLSFTLADRARSSPPDLLAAYVSPLSIFKKSEPDSFPPLWSQPSEHRPSENPTVGVIRVLVQPHPPTRGNYRYYHTVVLYPVLGMWYMYGPPKSSKPHPRATVAPRTGPNNASGSQLPVRTLRACRVNTFDCHRDPTGPLSAPTGGSRRSASPDPSMSDWR